MKSFYLTSLALALGLVSLSGVASAQSGAYGSPSLLPMPQANYRYPATQVSATMPQTAPQPGWNAYYTGQPPAGAGAAAPSPSDQVELLPQTHGHGEAYGSGVPYADGSCTSDFSEAMSAPWTGGSVLGCGYHGGWFAGAAGLFMGRAGGNPYYYSYYDSNEAGQMLRPDEIWSGGAQVWVGKWFGGGCGGGFGGGFGDGIGDACGCACGGGMFGVEGGYWGIYGDAAEQTLLAGQFPGNLNAILNFDQLNYNGAPANLSTDAAQIHRLRTDYEFHSAEFNFLGSTSPYGPYGISRFTWLAGFRYVRFDDDLQFASDPADQQFTGAVPELYYDVNVDNNLYGFQLGGRGEVFVIPQLSFDFGAKFGLFGNYIDHHSRIGGAAGDAVVNNGPFINQPFNVTSSASTISFLGELNAGASFWLTKHWRLTGGYRALAITGVALAADQIPMDLRGINDVQAIDADGSLILHGAYAGAEFTW
jgi:hypothetical protein